MRHHPILLSILALTLALLTAAAPAQTASFKSFGTACPNANATLQISGLPKLGSSFTVSGIRFPGGCTRRFCICNCCDCNTCFGSVLFLGVRKQTLQLTPQCQFLISTDVLLFGDSKGQITVSVPNQSGLNGVRFYMQRLDIGITQRMGTQCKTHYVPKTLQGSSNAVEGVAGR